VKFRITQLASRKHTGRILDMPADCPGHIEVTSTWACQRWRAERTIDDCEIRDDDSGANLKQRCRNR